LKRHWQMAFGKRIAEELYDVSKDPDCIINLAADQKYKEVMQKLRQQMESELKAQGDPRMFGRGDLFDRYKYANAEEQNFYERFRRGEKMKAGWVNQSDFEKEAIKD
jgi:N-sulfoglucosamine sulfohydrolase